MDGLNMGIIQQMPVLIPSIDKQRELITTFDALRKETQRLQEIYQYKRSLLNDLRSSVLSEAFAGNL